MTDTFFKSYLKVKVVYCFRFAQETQSFIQWWTNFRISWLNFTLTFKLSILSSKEDNMLV